MYAYINFMGFIKRFLLKRALKQKTTKSDLESIADEMLKDALKELQNTGRTADKILRAKIIRQESQNTLSKIRELDDEYDDEEEYDDEPDMEEIVTKGLIQKFLGNGAVPNPQQVAENPNLQETLKNLTPEEINALKKKFLS